MALSVGGAAGGATPRGGAGAPTGQRTPPPRLRRRSSAQRSARRRLSAADRDFLDFCVGGGDSDAEENFFTISSGSSSPCSSFGTASEGSPSARRAASPGASQDRAKAGLVFALNSASDSEDECSMAGSLELMFKFDELRKFGEDSESDSDGGEDLEELYRFDLERVAQALREGAGVEELTQVIEELMGASLEQRLEAEGAEGPESSQQSTATAEPTSGRSTPLMGNISGLMTPEQEREGGASPVPPSPEEISRRLVCRFADTPEPPEHRRRSSAANHPRLVEAINSSLDKRRENLRRLARACAEDCIAQGAPGRRMSTGCLRSVIARESKKHRWTMIRAAEVLEVAGIGVGLGGRQAPAWARREGESGLDAIAQQLRVVQSAMLAAQRRHRMSVTQAVTAVAASSTGRQMPCQSLAAEKVKEIIARAYAKRQAALQGARKPQAAAAPWGEAKAGAGRDALGAKARWLASAGYFGGNITALMHARSGDAGMKMHAVHIGPPPPAGGRRGRRCAVCR